MGLLFLIGTLCRSSPVPVDTGCAEAGNIDTVRFKMAGEKCGWAVECGAIQLRDWEICYREALTEMRDPVEDDAKCIDWCAARGYHQGVRGRDCAGYPSDGSELTELSSHFYTCETPNYE